MRFENIRVLKDAVRKEILKRLREQDLSSRNERSRIIQEKLLSSPVFVSSNTIMTYVSLPQEVDTCGINRAALEAGKRVVVPYIDEKNEVIIASEIKSMDELVKGPYGIYVPKDGLKKKIPLKEIDLIVVPGIAYDRSNGRLGRGKGYYDKFLSNMELSSARTIGLAFSFQLVDNLPVDQNDRPVSLVITD
ncbi:MAG TPA: 5-formyltetrahydrofolate cyclo-ligase [Candidatus Omnitrophota bacterium]|nr:5-formyltetrahydrofolate cyclo-ligase [Candidatus Omnitrophota bacterium]HPS19780.1 5-formyltetrahydrofolate cyclo-ligase [Candidatus Omnitrophota bacterium]